jgi:exodeoxyribonuclease VII large subunit
MEEQTQIGLYQLNQMVKEAIFDAFPSTIWIVAEISEIRFARNGHCYLELIEKEETSDHIIAKSRAAIWARTCNILKPYFEMTTGQELNAGMKVLVRVSVDFHELYSFNLTIHDIDPAYTMGDLARRRQEIIARLEEEGVMEMNKEIAMAFVPQRIAIISSATAAGLGDFLDQLNKNSYGVKFYTKLFSAIVQGQKAEESIMLAFDRIYQYADFFDVVCLIRGGGSKADLSCFDSYDLAYYITQFPLSVITGIGHERDDSIADLVAHTRMKTPTAVAEFLIERASEFESGLDELQEKIVDEVNDLIQSEMNRLNHLSLTFAPGVKEILNQKSNTLQQKAYRFQRATTEFIRKQDLQLHDSSLDIQHLVQQNISKKRNELTEIRKLATIRKNRFLLKKYHQLEIAENSNAHLNPTGVLKRGYSLTFKNGQVIKSSSELKKDDEITSRLYEGEIVSKVKELRK